MCLVSHICNQIQDRYQPVSGWPGPTDWSHPNIAAGLEPWPSRHTHVTTVTSSASYCACELSAAQSRCSQYQKEVERTSTVDPWLLTFADMAALFALVHLAAASWRQRSEACGLWLLHNQLCLLIRAHELRTAETPRSSQLTFS